MPRSAVGLNELLGRNTKGTDMSLTPYDNLERRELAKVRSGELRIVSSKRARKLRRRGEQVWWSHGACALVWSPWWTRKDGITLMDQLRHLN